MNILITGGAGFIGRHLIDALDASDCITVIDNMSPQIHDDCLETIVFPENVNFINADIRDDLEDLRGKSFDVCYHLAAETGTAQSMFDTKKYYDVNIMGTINLLEKLQNLAHVKRFVLASSRSVYGEGDYSCSTHGIHTKVMRTIEHLSSGKFIPVCEYCNEELVLEAASSVTSVNPLSQYAATKYTQELLVENFCRQNDKNFSIFRFQNVYGSGQSLKNPYTGVLAAFANLSLSNMAISVYEDGYCSRDFVHVKDVVNVLSNHQFIENSNARITDLGSGTAVPLIDVANFVSSYFDCNIPPAITGQFRIGDIRSNFTEIPISDYLKFDPVDFFSEGLPDFLEFARKNFNPSYLESIQKAANETKNANILRGSIDV